LSLTLALTVGHHTAHNLETYHGIDFQHFSLSYFDQTVTKLIDQGREAECKALEEEFKADTPELKSAVGDHIESPTFARDVRIACKTKRLFGTPGGYIGVGDITLQNNDLIGVLFGGNVPFILRPMGNRYRLVGECYLHGIMHGEAIEEGKAKRQWFELR
jgi:hypothetical protein